jgi:hypothetical protein
MIGFGELWNVVSFIAEKLKESSRLKREQLREYYDLVIEPSYHDLESIHKNYIQQLSELRTSLKNRSMPPAELVSWVRRSGLEFRTKREALSTFETELENFDNLHQRQLVGESNDAFLRNLNEYASEVVEYLKCTTSHNESPSLYRGFEGGLARLLSYLASGQEGISQDSPEGFYANEYVLSLDSELATLCDIRLTEQWKRITEKYRALRFCVLQP